MLGHLIRHDAFMKTIIEGKIEGRKVGKDLEQNTGNKLKRRLPSCRLSRDKGKSNKQRRTPIAPPTRVEFLNLKRRRYNLKVFASEYL